MPDEICIKKFVIRIPKDMWTFLKLESIDQEVSMNQVIIRQIKKMKKSKEKLLTPPDNVVS